MPAKLVAPLIAVMLCAACARSDEGMLEPVSAPGVTVVRDAAIVRRDEIAAHVRGDWSSSSGTTIDITYRNSGIAAAHIPIGDVTITFAGGKAQVEQISDVTRVNLEDSDHRNDSGRSLMEDAEAPDRPGIVIVPAGQVRKVQISFSPFVEDRRPVLRDVLTLTIPMPRESARIGMRCAGP